MNRKPRPSALTQRGAYACISLTVAAVVLFAWFVARVAFQ